MTSEHMTVTVTPVGGQRWVQVSSSSLIDLPTALASLEPQVRSGLANRPIRDYFPSVFEALASLEPRVRSDLIEANDFFADALPGEGEPRPYTDVWVLGTPATAPV